MVQNWNRRGHNFRWGFYLGTNVECFEASAGCVLGVVCLPHLACAAFLAAALRFALDTPCHRALPPLARFSSGHSWPHFGHLFICFAHLTDGHCLGGFDAPVAKHLDQHAITVALPKDKADALLAFLLLAVPHDVIYFHAVVMHSSLHFVNCFICFLQ